MDNMSALIYWGFRRQQGHITFTAVVLAWYVAAKGLSDYMIKDLLMLLEPDNMV